VLLTHTAFLTGTYADGWVGTALARCDIGVAIFFVLSGFLLTRPWAAAADAAPSVRRYAVHRVARILPAYWVALLAVALTTARGAGAGPLVSNALLLQTYTDSLLPGFTQTWSLVAEVAFYAVLPFLAPWVRARGRARVSAVRLALLSVVGLAWVALVAGGAITWPWASTWLPGHLLWFAVGMGLALLEGAPRASTRAARAVRDLAAAPTTVVVLALAAFWLVSTSLGGPIDLGPTTAWQAVAKETLYGIVGGLVVLAAAFAPSDGSWVRRLGGRTGLWAGRLSYAVFLWHLVVVVGVMDVLGLHDFSGGFVVVTSLTGLGSVAVALASWVVVEHPALVRVTGRSR
jgi:peptidoglycan/LPS O-acetylase OafA/YrhL